MKQISPEQWLSGDSWAVCSLARTAEELSQHHDIRFTKELDNLGVIFEAAFRDPTAGQVVLWWRDHPVFRSTEVVVDTSVSRDHGLSAVWLALRLDIRAMDWVNPYSKFPGYEAEPRLRPVTAIPPIFERLGDLSGRESSVLQLLSDGLGTPEIATELRIAPSTVSGHLQRIYLKLGVHSRAELREVLKRFPHLARSA